MPGRGLDISGLLPGAEVGAARSVLQAPLPARLRQRTVAAVQRRGFKRRG
jgi:hypothetical protein